jgi:hypothetical protein
MEPDAGSLRPAASGGDRDVESITFAQEQLPLDRCSQVTQDCTRPAREDGGNEAALSRELLVSKRVHTAPQSLQSPCGNPVVKPTAVEPARLDLVLCDHAELPRRHHGNPPIHRRCRSFSRTVMGFLRHPWKVALWGALGCCCL